MVNILFSIASEDMKALNKQPTAAIQQQQKHNCINYLEFL